MSLKLSDVRTGVDVRSRTKIIQKKTGNPVEFGIMDRSRDAIRDWCEFKRLEQCDWLFQSWKDCDRHLSTRQYARLVDDRVQSIGLRRSADKTHSTRRTKATLIYRKTGNRRALRLLLGHTKTDSMVWSLGVELEDALKLAESIGP